MLIHFSAPEWERARVGEGSQEQTAGGEGTQVLGEAVAVGGEEGGEGGTIQVKFWDATIGSSTNWLCLILGK